MSIAFLHTMNIDLTSTKFIIYGQALRWSYVSSKRNVLFNNLRIWDHDCEVEGIWTIDLQKGKVQFGQEKNKVNNSGTLVLFIMKFSKRKVVGKVLHILLLYQVGFVKIVSAKKRKRKIRKVNRCLVQAKLYQLERKICCYSKSGNTRCIICKMVVSCNGKWLTYQITLSLQNTV